jgi:hypothetical protein
LKNGELSPIRRILAGFSADFRRSLALAETLSPDSSVVAGT